MQSSPEQNPISTSGRKPQKNPWPMWPIGLAILAFIAFYTWVNLKYRKAGQAFEPSQAMSERQQAIVDKNFYDWYRLEATLSETLSDLEQKADVKIRNISGPLENELPEQLVYYIPSRPLLVPISSPLRVSHSVVSKQSIQLQLKLNTGLATHPRFRLQAFYKEGELYLLASLLASSLEEAKEALESPIGTSEFLVPTAPIDSNQVIEATLLSQGQARSWQVQIESALPE